MRLAVPELSFEGPPAVCTPGPNPAAWLTELGSWDVEEGASVVLCAREIWFLCAIVKR